MDIEQTALFLASSVLLMISLVVVVIGSLIINNLIHKYWKNLGWKLLPAWLNEPAVLYVDKDKIPTLTDKIEPTVDLEKIKKTK